MVFKSSNFALLQGFFGILSLMHLHVYFRKGCQLLQKRCWNFDNCIDYMNQFGELGYILTVRRSPSQGSRHDANTWSVDLWDWVVDVC